MLEVALIFIALRVAASLAGAVAASLVPLEAPCEWAATRFGWDPMPPLHADGIAYRLLGIWERWDACWYLRIAAFGYGVEGDAVAFFPLFPSSVGILHAVGLDATLAALLVAGGAAIAAAIGVLRLVAADFGLSTARRTVLLLLVAPPAVFLLAPFTEPLFLALVVWTLAMARDGHWGRAALLGALAGLTRAHGVLLVLPLAWLAFRGAPRIGRANADSLLRAVAVVAPVIAVAAYSIWAGAVIGETPWQAQERWSQRFAPPWEVVATAIHRLKTAQPPDDPLIQGINLAIFVGAVALFAVGLRRLPAFYSLYAAPHVLLLSSRIVEPSPVASAGRFALVVFPLFVVLALVLARRSLFVAWLIVSAVVLAGMLYAFWAGLFVG